MDAYSPCPGGTGKKIKFCCGDFLPELQKIDRMVEGEQYTACLQHIEQLLAREPGRDRECLLATKCMLLRATGQQEAARNTAATFVVKYPQNQIALAEMAILAAESNVRAAVDMLQRAIRAAAGNLAGRTYQAMGLVAGNLLHAGLPLAARGLLHLQSDIAEDDDRPAGLLAALDQAVDIPLLLRDEMPLVPCSSDAPWHKRFDEAMQAVALGDWQTAADGLTALAGEAPDAAAVWRNLAVVRGWLADNAGCGEALRRYAAIRAKEADGLEDAVEAEAEAMFLSDDPLGDRLEMFKIVWTVGDAERVQEALLSSPRWRAVAFDPARFSDGENPPPKGAYTLLDRPMPESADGLAQETMPLMIGQALLFGRQTDREARLEVLGVAADELEAVDAMVREAVGANVEPEAKREVTGRWSATRKLLRAAWQPPRSAEPKRLLAMMSDYTRDAIINRWPGLKLGVLNDRSPRDAASDADCRTRLAAAIMVIEQWAERMPGAIDFNELRSKLGLPTLGPIDAHGDELAMLPTVRLGRVNVESLSDEELTSVYLRATGYAIRDVSRKFAAAIVARPSMAGSDQQLHAYATLARTEEDAARALEYINLARRAADGKKISHAMWDLMELSIHFANQDGPEAMRLIEHIQNRHIEEPGVGETLTRMLIDVGLLRPDGTPAFEPQAGEPTMAAEASEPGGLWTPDGDSRLRAAGSCGRRSSGSGRFTRASVVCRREKATTRLTLFGFGGRRAATANNIYLFHCPPDYH